MAPDTYSEMPSRVNGSSTLRRYSRRMDGTGTPQAGLRLPYNIDAEQAVLSAVLADPERLHKLSGLEADHFYDPANKALFALIGTAVKAGITPNPVSLAREAAKDPNMAAVGGSGYVEQLACLPVLGTEWKSSAKVVRDYAVRRNLILAANEMAALAAHAPLDSDSQELLQQAGALLDNARKSAPSKSKAVPLSVAIKEQMAAIEDGITNGNKLRGVTTGLVTLDQHMRGLRGSDLIIVAGRPAMGKTGFGLKFALGAAESGVPVAFYSQEMSRQSLASRALAQSACVSMQEQENGVNPDQLYNLNRAAEDLSRLPLIIDDSSAMSIEAMTAQAYDLKRQHNIGLLIVDYLQLMRTARRTENRVVEVTAIAEGLKKIAKDLQIPVIALSQLSRAVEGRDDKRPNMGDLRESGGIEQAADVVMLLFREEYYLQRNEPRQRDNETQVAYQERWAKWTTRMGEVRGTCEVIIDKFRNGSTGSVRVGYDGMMQRILDVDVKDPELVSLNGF